MANLNLKPGETKVIAPTDAENLADALPLTDDQKMLKALIERRHPFYEDRLNHWRFLEATYEGGRSWFSANIFRYIKEGDKEYADRLERAYRFNHSREIVDLLNKHLFKQNIARNEADAPESVKKFWKKATRNGLPIKDFSRQISKKSSIHGRIGIVVDTNAPKNAIVSKADEEKIGSQTYAYIVGPEQLLDFAYDSQGQLEWILIEEVVREDDDPFTSSGKVKSRYRLWTKIYWMLIEETMEGRKKVIKIVDHGIHNLGVVPVVLADNLISDEEYVSPSMIDDIAYLDRAVANYLSNLDAIIQDQTFSQLAMPAQNVLPGEDNYNKLLEMGTKRMFLYDGEGGAQPFYLSPDVKQAELIVTVVNKIINEIYHSSGLAGERTKQDNAVGTDNSSGVAKAYDFERVNSLLAAKADSLEVVENKIAYLVALWNGEEGKIKQDLVSYPDDFDTRSLYDEFDIAARLSLIAAPEGLRREQMKSLIDKLFPQLAEDLRKKMESELKEWPVDPLEDPNVTGGKPVSKEKPTKEKRQGQVTEKTK